MSLIAGSYERFLFGFAVPDGLAEPGVGGGAPAPLRRTFTEGAHRGAVRSVAAAGRLVASGGPEDLVRLMDAHTGADLGLLACPGRGAVSALAFAAPPQGPEPCELLAGSADGSVSVWRRSDGWDRAEVLSLSAQSKAWEAREEAKALEGVEGGEDEKGGGSRGGLASSSSSRREKKRERAARFREARRQEEQAKDEEEEGGELEDPASYTDPAEAEAAAARLGWRARRRGATAYAAATSTTEERLAAHASGSAARDVEMIAPHPSGAAALSATRDGWLRTWDLGRRRELAGARLPLPARAVAFCDDARDAHGPGRYAVAAGRIVEVHGASETNATEKHTNGEESRREEASASPSPSSPSSPRELVHPGFKAPIALAWASRRFLVSGDEGGTLRLWDLEQPRGRELVAERKAHGMRVRALVAEPRPMDRALVAAGKADEPGKGGASERSETRLVASCGTDGLVKIWRIALGEDDQGLGNDDMAKEKEEGGEEEEEERGEKGEGAKKATTTESSSNQGPLRLVAQGSTGGARLTCLAWAPRLEEAEAAGKITKRLRKRAAEAETEDDASGSAKGRKGEAKEGGARLSKAETKKSLKGSSIALKVRPSAKASSSVKAPLHQDRRAPASGASAASKAAGKVRSGAKASPGSAPKATKRPAPASAPAPAPATATATATATAAAVDAAVPGTVSFMTDADERKLQRQRKKARFDAERASKKLKSLRKKKAAPAFE